MSQSLGVDFARLESEVSGQKGLLYRMISVTSAPGLQPEILRFPELVTMTPAFANMVAVRFQSIRLAKLQSLQGNGRS